MFPLLTICTDTIWLITLRDQNAIAQNLKTLERPALSDRKAFFPTLAPVQASQAVQWLYKCTGSAALWSICHSQCFRIMIFAYGQFKWTELGTKTSSLPQIKTG